jgi:hypothetical protein
MVDSELVARSDVVAGDVMMGLSQLIPAALLASLLGAIYLVL